MWEVGEEMRKEYLLSNGQVVYPTKEQWDLLCYPVDYHSLEG
jgi:hypothetical protein